MSIPAEVIQVHYHIHRRWNASVEACEKGLYDVAGQAIYRAIGEIVDSYIWDIICDNVYFEIVDHYQNQEGEI